jgi:hypothetical protein
MNQTVKQHRFLKYLWLLHTPKKLIQSHLLRPGSGSATLLQIPVGVILIFGAFFKYKPSRYITGEDTVPIYISCHSPMGLNYR